MNEPNDMLDNDEALAARAKALFDESVEELDAATLSKLNQGRQQALGQLGRRPALPRWLPWAPAAGVAAAAVLAVVIFTGEGPVDELTPPTAVADIEIILDGDDFEMLEDLEFYSWIDQEDWSESDDEPDSNVG